MRHSSFAELFWTATAALVLLAWDCAAQGDSPERLRFIARVSSAIENDDLSAAESEFRKQLERYPDWSEGNVQFGGLLVCVGKLEEGKGNLRHAEELFLQQGRKEEASALAEVIRDESKLKPRLARFVNDMAYELGRRQAWIETEPIARVCILLAPDWPYGHLALGNALFHTNRLQEAERALRNAIELVPDVAEAHSSLASTMRWQGRLAEAEKEARKGIELKEGWADSWVCLCLTLEQLERYGEMQTVCKRAVELNSGYAPSYIALANALRRMGRVEEAERYSRQAVELAPKSCDALIGLGQVLLEKGALEQAKERFREAGQQCPDDIRPRIGLASVLGLEGKTEEADHLYRAAIKWFPADPRPHIEYAAFLIRAKRLNEAEKELRAAVRVEPDSPSAHYRLGLFLVRREKCNDAETEFREMLRLSPGYADAKQTLCSLLRLKAGKLHKVDVRAAEETLREVMQLCPTDPAAYNDLGYVLIAEPNRWDEAESLIRKSIELNPDPALVPYSWGTLAELLANQPSRKAEALAAYRRAIAGFTSVGKSNEARSAELALKHFEKKSD